MLREGVLGESEGWVKAAVKITRRDCGEGGAGASEVGAMVNRERAGIGYEREAASRQHIAGGGQKLGLGEGRLQPCSTAF